MSAIRPFDFRPAARPRSAFRFALPVAVCLALAGCGGSLLSGAGPSIRSITSADENTPVGGGARYEVVDLSADSIATYMRPPEMAPVHTVAPTSVPDVRLVPGDVLSVMIADNGAGEAAMFAPLAGGGTLFPKVRLDSKGRISLPYVGQVTVRGKTLSEVEQIIRSTLRGKVTDPQVHVELSGDLSGSVLVAGAVKAPGRFSAMQGPLTLLDAINQAGGPVLEPHLIRVVLRTGSDAQIFSYQDLLNGRNQVIPPHSEIIVERARKRFVAMGAVTQPGLHDLPSDNPSLLEVLGVAGGLRESSADPSGVFIFRLAEPEPGTDGKPTARVFRLDMKTPEAIFLARQFLVQPEDAVYVTNAAVYEWQKIISPIVQVLLLGRIVHNGYN